MNNLEEHKLIEDVFNLIKIEQISLFKNDLELSSDQTNNLVNELHEFLVLICEANKDQIKKRKIDRSISNLASHRIACDLLLDHLYEILNTGKWFEVDIKLRYTFGLITLYFISIQLNVFIEKLNNKFDKNEKFQFILKLLNKIDYALIYSPPFLNRLLPRIATKFHNYLIIQMPINLNAIEQAVNNPQIEKSKAIRRVKCIDLNDFYLNYFNKKEPIIIENAIDDWPAIEKWNLNYLANKSAYRLIPVEIGSKYSDTNWTQKVLTIKEFIDKFIINQSDNLKGYCAQYELFDRIDELSNDFYIPDYCALIRDGLKDKEDKEDKEEEEEDKEGKEEEDVHINAWFGPKNTISPLHNDAKDNLLSQVFGSKYIRLYSPKIANENYYLYDSYLLSNTSRVDVENNDLIRREFPKFPLDYQEAILAKGDLLYIPEKHWHYVRSLSTSFSISFWWK